jgi:hypothetical protein
VSGNSDTEEPKMTTTARQATRRIITDTTAISALVLLGLEFDFADCEICTLPAAELFERIDNRDGAEISVCEHCADTADVSHIAD